MAAKRFKSYSGPRRTDGLPDRRTAAGKRAWSRSDAAKRGWNTRRERAEERDRHFPPDFVGTGYEEDFGEDEWIVEEPIETVGGKKYGKKG
jgi:hypothetical protein